MMVCVILWGVPLLLRKTSCLLYPDVYAFTCSRSKTGMCISQESVSVGDGSSTSYFLMGFCNFYLHQICLNFSHSVLEGTLTYGLEVILIWTRAYKRKKPILLLTLQLEIPHLQLISRAPADSITIYLSNGFNKWVNILDWNYLYFTKPLKGYRCFLESLPLGACSFGCRC